MGSVTQLILDALHSGEASLSDRAFAAYLNSRDTLGQTALHVACRDGHTALASVLLAAGADPGICDNGMNTPVSAAVRSTNHHSRTNNLERRDLRRGFCGDRLAIGAIARSGCLRLSQRHCGADGECGRL